MTDHRPKPTTPHLIQLADQLGIYIQCPHRYSTDPHDSNLHYANCTRQLGHDGLHHSDWFASSGDARDWVLPDTLSDAQTIYRSLLELDPEERAFIFRAFCPCCGSPLDRSGYCCPLGPEMPTRCPHKELE
jgi:hypothetical protein